MNLQTISAVIMVGGGDGSTPQERIVLRAQQAAALDLIDTLKREGVMPIVVAAPTADWLPVESGVILDLDPPGDSFHFGRRLAGVIEARGLSQVMYFGGGSAPLLDGSMAELLLGLLWRSAFGGPESSIPSHIALTNNLHSSDWVAITNALDALPIITEADRDNSLAWLLNNSGEFEVRVVTGVRPAAGLDIDTPTDVALVANHPGLKPHLADMLEGENLLDVVPVQEIADVLATPESNAALIGRVSPQAWQALNKATSCWVRVYAEERGMVASGRATRGEVKSLVAALIREQGPYAFFKTLSEMTDAAIIDSRPLMAAQGPLPSDADRFASDLFLVDQIENPWLKEFTAAAAEAPIPVMLGGHSVVAGGLYALIEIVEGLKRGKNIR